MRDWIHWLWQQWEWEGDLSPELTREIARAEEALLGTFTPEQRELYEALLLGGGLAAEILGKADTGGIGT